MSMSIDFQKKIVSSWKLKNSVRIGAFLIQSYQYQDKSE